MQQWFYKLNWKKGNSQPTDSVRHLEKLCVFVKVSFLWLCTALPWYGQFVLCGSSFYPGQMCCRSLWNFVLLLLISIISLNTSLYWARVSITIFMPWHPDAENLFLFTWKKQAWKTLIRWSLLQIYTAPTAEIRMQSQEHAGISLAKRRLTVLLFISGNIPLWKKAVEINLD